MKVQVTFKTDYEATGLVTNKVYADGKGPTYTYTPDGKLATRTWARGIATAGLGTATVKGVSTVPVAVR